MDLQGGDGAGGDAEIAAGDRLGEAIGIEFASFYRDMGAEVTVVEEELDRVLPVEDEEISAFARKAFEKQGIKIHTGAAVKGLKKGADNVTAQIEAGGKAFEVTVDRVISAVGITGNVEDLGLEGTAVKVDRTHVVTDEWLRTGEAGVYAIGDLVGPPWLAHKAMHEGVICVEHIAGLNGVHPLDLRQYPRLHLLPAAGRSERRPHLKRPRATRATRSRSGISRSSATARRSALGESPRGWIKTVFDGKHRRMCSAPTWSAPRSPS